MKKSLLLLIPALFLIASCGDEEKEQQNPEPPRHEHIFSTDWKYDATSHFHECDCGEKQDTQDHVDSNNDNICEICGFNIPIPPCPEGQHVNNNEDEDMLCDICGYPMEYKHAKSVGGDPSAPFFLKVDEEKEIKVTLDPTPTRAVEKIFTWKSSDDAIASVEVDPSNTAKAKIVGKKAGKVTFTATNTYNPNTLFRKFEATVVEFSDENMNLWEYKSEDKSQFGYTSDNKQGVASGTAVLNGLSWEFTRSEAISLNLSKGGMLGFGKGSDPETLVKLVNHNLRKVKSISIETCSANGLAALTVKVGDTTVIEGSTPSSNKDSFPAMSSGALEDLTGDISIQFDTPAMDPSRVEDDTYLKPGSVYIKSFWIVYAAEEIEYKTIKTYDFATMYADTESDFYKSLKSTAGPQMLEDDDYVISFAKVGKSTATETLSNYAKTNSDIELKLKKTDEVIKSVTFEYKSGGTANQYNVLSSNLGGAPYLNQNGSGNDSKVTATIIDPNINAIELHPNKTNYVGLISITIKTVEGEHAVIDSISFADGAKPTKVEYNEGDVFEPEGLGLATVKFTNSEIEDVEIGTDSFIFYDGPSFDEPTDHSGKKLELSAGTTYVVGVYQNHNVKIEGLTVTIIYKTLSRISTVEDLTNGNYLFVIPGSKQYWKGSMANADMKKTDSIANLGDIEIDDTINVPSSYLKDALIITNDSGSITIANQNGGKIGMTASGNFAIASSPEYKTWTASVTDDVIDFVIAGGEYTKHLTFGSKFDLGASSSANIALYKIGE